ncbi:MAG: alpha/beta fold hydrolase [Woeseiaceae bacterium]|nr:alpha/beta fold hydrolase [Woeseiaceae bacterium]
MSAENVTIAARDGFKLSATLYRGEPSNGNAVIISSATAVPRRFYRHFAAALAERGYSVITYDYRGIGDSRPATLRGFDARTSDWALLDMAGVVDWVREHLQPKRLYKIGHSVGGQVAGLLDNSADVDGMVTLSAQSGYWLLQGGEQKLVAGLHVHVTLPILSHLFGYMPWSKFSSAEDLPKGAALQWSRWCRDPKYLLGDTSLPLERYESFTAPVLAYSIDDDKWGTARSVDAMMSIYPNLERRHIDPDDHALESLGHFGYFRPHADRLWEDAMHWLDELR